MSYSNVDRVRRRRAGVGWWHAKARGSYTIIDELEVVVGLESKSLNVSVVKLTPEVRILG